MPSALSSQELLLNNLVNSDSAYDAYMANFAASQFTPMQRALGMGV